MVCVGGNLVGGGLGQFVKHSAVFFLAENWVELREKKNVAFIWSREINSEANVKSEVFWLKPYRG